MITNTIAIQKTFVVLGATREWHLMILAHDSGEVQRQSNSLSLSVYICIFSTVNLILALCSLHIKLIDINDNPPGKTKLNCNKRKKNLNYVFSFFKF